MIKSPLRYPGGKSRAVDLIATLIPSFDEFREPFLGGGSVFINLKQRFPEKKFWVNDLYPELYLFWKMCQTQLEAVIGKVYEFKKLYPAGKELHFFLKDNWQQWDEVEKAAAFFIFNRTTFSGTTLSGGYSEQANIGRFTQSSIQRLKEFGKVIQSAEITNLDYADLVKKDGENIFIFLDPPYFSATKSALYGKNGDMHKTFDHRRFAETMKNCNHRWLITYDDSPYIRKLFSFAYIISWDLTYGMRNINKNSDQIGKELFISNYLERFPAQRQMNLFEPDMSLII